MKNSPDLTELHSIDEQNSVTLSLPAFVTRTTLQSILHANGVRTLSELEAQSVDFSQGILMPSSEPESE